MSVDETLCYTRLKAGPRNCQPLFAPLRSVTQPTLGESGVGLWDAWSGVFGIGSNDRVLMTSANPRLAFTGRK